MGFEVKTAGRGLVTGSREKLMKQAGPRVKKLVHLS